MFAARYEQHLHLSFRLIIMCKPPFSPVSIIPAMLHTRLHLCVAVSRRANGQRLERSKSDALSENGELLIEK